MPTYRCVKANDSDEVIAIGADENQGGIDYHGIGVWCDFTFTEFPEIPEEVWQWANQNEYRGSLLKVVNNQLVPKTLEELQ